MPRRCHAVLYMAAGKVSRMCRSSCSCMPPSCRPACTQARSRSGRCVMRVTRSRSGWCVMRVKPTPPTTHPHLPSTMVRSKLTWGTRLKFNAFPRTCSVTYPLPPACSPPGKGRPPARLWPVGCCTECHGPHCIASPAVPPGAPAGRMQPRTPPPHGE